MVELPAFAVVLQSATAVADWVLVLPLVLCLLGAAVLLTLGRLARLRFALVILVVAAVVVLDAAMLLRVVNDGPFAMTMGNWLPPFGISFVADVFGAGFALTAALATLVVVVYARGDDAVGEGFYPLILLLLAGVTGSFLTGDLFNLYVWFEVMLIASFGLIVQSGQRAQLDAAVKYGFLNFLATALFLLALGLLYGLLGTLNMADIMRLAPSANLAACTAIAAVLLVAFSMKAAAFPLNAWLPASYHTPPVAISAIFAGLLTKVGAYALLRVLVVVLPTSRDILEPALVAIAVATLLIGPLGAIAETNLRRSIGFMVIGGIGAFMTGIALPSLAGVSGAGLYIVHAMLTMTALYLVAGIVERHTGQKDWRHMGGVYAASAPISIMFLALVLATAGVPPFLGFWPKLLLLQSSIEAGGWAGVLLAIALVGNAILTLIAGTRLWSHIFWRPAPQAIESPRIDPLVQAAAAALVTIVVAAGLWPNGLFEALKLGAPNLLDPARYVAAVGLAGVLP